MRGVFERIRFKIDVWFFKREIALMHEAATEILQRIREERKGEMRDVQECLQALGRTAEDKVTGFVGVVESVCFDLYGCVQTIVRPQVGDKNEMPEGKWLDFDRLTFEGEPVMQQPSFVTQGSVADKGAAEKPARERG